MADPGPDEPLRQRERRRLAHELHDIVSHHLANVAVRTMGGWERYEAAELRAVLGEVHEAAGAALGELRLLGRLLPGPSDGADGAAGDQDRAAALDDLCRVDSPRVAALHWRDRLRAAGLDAGCAVPPAADDLPRSVRATVVRSLEASALAQLRLAAPGARCTATVDVKPGRVVVRTTTAPPPEGLDDPAGSSAVADPEELRGLRERVVLVAGRFATDVATTPTGGPRWVVTVVVPLD